jgi:hypothetical protein
VTHQAERKTWKREAIMSDPRTADMLLSYVESHMAGLGPYVSSVFFILLLRSAAERRRGGFIRIRELSIDEIADSAGISKRKAIDALKVLRNRWMIVQRSGKGRGNKNRYYFLPPERWLHAGNGHQRRIRRKTPSNPSFESASGAPFELDNMQQTL